MNNLSVINRHKKIVLALIIILVMVAAMLWLPGLDRRGATIAIDPPNTLNQAGQLWTASVAVKSNQPVNSVDTTISYDPSLVEVQNVDISDSDFEMKVFEPIVDTKAGTIRFVQTSLQSHEGQSTIATIDLKGIKQGQLKFGVNQTKIVADDGQGTDLFYPKLNQSLGSWLLSLIKP